MLCTACTFQHLTHAFTLRCSSKPFPWFACLSPLRILQVLAASHYTSDASVTVLLKERRVSPSSETKLGKAPENVDYVGKYHICLVAMVCNQAVADVGKQAKSDAHLLTASAEMLSTS